MLSNDYLLSPRDFLNNFNLRKALAGLFYYKKNEHLFKESEDVNLILEELLLSMNQRKALYQKWTRKEGNKKRTLSVPNGPLQRFLRDYVLELVKRERVHETCHGGESGWSPKKSLETHVPCSCALSFDLKSAFENTSFAMVLNFFNDSLRYYFDNETNREISGFLSIINTVYYDESRGLPQGSPTSMALFNRILFFLDNKLFKKCNERGLKYTRWVDDITVSSNYQRRIEELLGAVELVEEFFPISKEKIFFQNAGTFYLLGHKINDGVISKNSKEERLEHKVPFLNFDEWFGKSAEKKYESW